LEKGATLQYRIGWHLSRLFFKVFMGLRCEGRPLPEEGCILASNHKSYLDPPLVGSCVHKAINYLAKEELFRTRLGKSVLDSVGAIAVRRGRPTAKQLETCLERLKEGGILLVFPEGTRIRRPGFGSPRRGVGFISRRAGVPVVPVYVSGTYRWWRALLRRPPVSVRFGAPLRVEADEEDDAISERVLQAIATLGEPEGAPERGD
jgi:1-acyl-sn-glycerol-3-phosphate acyltransferase